MRSTLLLMAFAACHTASVSVGSACKLTSQCVSGSFCLASSGKCSSGQCGVDADCASGQTCAAHQCVTGGVGSKIPADTPVEVQVYGVTSGTVQLSLNGSESATASADGTVTFKTTLAVGATYTVTVAGSPTGQVCSARFASGKVTAPTTVVDVHCVGAAAPTYGTATNWSSYVDRADPTAPCDVDNFRSYASCIHVGEKRQVVVPGLSDCADASPQDTLGAFTWSCAPATGGLVFQSHEVRGGKGVRDLIDFSVLAWKADALVVHTAGGDVTSLASVWWTNPIVALALPDDPATTAATGTAQGAVYVVNATNAAAGYQLDGSAMTLVTAPGVVIKPPATYPNPAVGGSGSFMWLEVDITGNGPSGPAGQRGISMYPEHFEVVNNAHIQNLSGTVLGWDGAKSWLVRNSVFASAPTGVVCYEACYSNTFRDVTFENIDGIAINFSSAPQSLDNVFYRTTVTNTLGTGIVLSGVASGDPNTSNLLIGTTTAFNDGSGILSQYSPLTTLINTTSVSNLAEGIENNPGEALTVENYLGLANEAGINYDPSVRLNQFILADNTSAQFNSTGAAVLGSVQISTTAALPSSNLFASPGATPTSLATITSFAYAPDGSPLLAGQGYGPSGTTLPAAVGAANAGPFALWDFALLASSTAALGVNTTPVDTQVAHQWTLPIAANCGDFFRGSSASGSYCKTEYLSFAVEIFGDDIGNDNGLCESGEACILSPNIGAYQGEDDLRLVNAAFATGPFTGITLYAFSKNGR